MFNENASPSPESEKTTPSSSLDQLTQWGKDTLTKLEATARGGATEYIKANCLKEKGGPAKPEKAAEVAKLVQGPQDGPALNQYLKDIKGFPLSREASTALLQAADKTASGISDSRGYKERPNMRLARSTYATLNGDPNVAAETEKRFNLTHLETGLTGPPPLSLSGHPNLAQIYENNYANPIARQYDWLRSFPDSGLVSPQAVSNLLNTAVADLNRSGNFRSTSVDLLDPEHSILFNPKASIGDLRAVLSAAETNILNPSPSDPRKINAMNQLVKRIETAKDLQERSTPALDADLARIKNTIKTGDSSVTT